MTRSEYGRAARKLTDTKIRALKPRDRKFTVADGGGLAVEVTPAGGKLWRLSMRYDGKPRRLALGQFPTINVRVARAMHSEFLKDLQRHGWKAAAVALHRQTLLRQALQPAGVLSRPSSESQLIEEFDALFGRDRHVASWDGRKLMPPNPDLDRTWQQRKSVKEFPAFTGQVTIRRKR